MFARVHVKIDSGIRVARSSRFSARFACGAQNRETRPPGRSAGRLRCTRRRAVSRPARYWRGLQAGLVRGRRQNHLARPQTGLPHRRVRRRPHPARQRAGPSKRPSPPGTSNPRRRDLRQAAHRAADPDPRSPTCTPCPRATGRSSIRRPIRCGAARASWNCGSGPASDEAERR